MNNKLISMRDAIKAIEEKSKRIKNEDTLNGLAGAAAILLDLPSVNPQEPILNKLRAEIEALNPVDYVSMSSYEGHRGASDMKDDVLAIIDKCGDEANK